MHRWMSLELGMLIAIALPVGCGRGASSEPAQAPTPSSSGGGESGPSSARWLSDVPEGGVLVYEVALADGERRRVQMQVQQVVRRGHGVAVRLAPIGTPLDEEPVYPRWIVGDEHVLVGLEETAALTSEAGYAPIDEAGRMRTEVMEHVTWRLFRDWLLVGATVSGGEVSMGWRLAERIDDLDRPVTGRGCVRLERDEAGARIGLLVCANLGVVEQVRMSRSGTVEERWSLIRVEPPLRIGDEENEALHGRWGTPRSDCRAKPFPSHGASLGTFTA